MHVYIQASFTGGHTIIITADNTTDQKHRN